ncbi:MAG TPA: DUF6198 family protein [Methanocorpusculum sp.]|nr:DUF6198 family protein [Methanocorpusculum sp.]
MQSLRRLRKIPQITFFMHILGRWVLCFIGVFTMGFGIALSIRAGLGISPISCLPYVLNQWLGISVGTMTFAVNIIFVALQIAILRKNYPIYQLLQLPLLFVFSAAIDFSLWLLSGAVTDLYLLQFCMMLLSCFIIALGIFFMLKAELLMMPGDALVRAIAVVSQKEFGKVKVIFDCTLVAVAAVTSLCALQCIVGIREGSLAAALLVGTIARLLMKISRRGAPTD